MRLCLSAGVWIGYACPTAHAQVRAYVRVNAREGEPPPASWRDSPSRFPLAMRSLALRPYMPRRVCLRSLMKLDTLKAPTMRMMPRTMAMQPR